MGKTVKGGHSAINAFETGIKLQKIRRERGLTQERLAEMVGVTAKTISLWECGDRVFSLNNLMILSRVLGASTEDILCFAEDVVLSSALKSLTTIRLFPF